MNWQNHPLLRLAIPLTLGMVGAYSFSAHTDTAALFILCGALLAFLFFFIKKTEDTIRDTRFGILAMALAFLVGMALYTGKRQRTEKGVPADSTFCQGVLSAPPTPKAHSWALPLELANGSHIILYIGKDRHTPGNDTLRFSTLQRGDTIFAHLKHLNPTSHQGSKTLRPYYRRLFHQGICATAYAPPRQWSVHPMQDAPSLLRQAQGLQDRLHRIYDDHGMDGEAGSIVEAMTIGRKADLPPHIRQAYASAGISHVLALSGFHVGIIAFMLQTLFFGRLLPLRWQRVSHALVIAALWSYALMAGMAPSLTRATLMFSIILLGQSFGRDHQLLDTCTLALLIMLCFNPFYLHDIGFQLSFFAVFGIALWGMPVIRLCPGRNAFLRLLWNILSISLVCTIFTAPLVAYHFGSIPLFAVASNLAVTLFTYAIMGGSLLWWLFLWCEPINHTLTQALGHTAATMNSISTHMASLPHATLEWHPSLPLILLCYAAFLAFTRFLHPQHEKP